MTAKVVPPGGYLMHIKTAAKELGVEVAELLAYAEDRGANTALRVCVMVPDECVVFPISEPQPEPAGLELEDRCFAFVDGLNLEGVPRFFRELRLRGRATLRDCLPMVMVDLSGWVSADGMEVRLEELMVPREDIERLRVSRAEELSEKRAETLLKIIGALARLIAKTETGGEFGTEDNPNARAIAKDLAGLVPDGSPAESTIADKLNEGLAALNAVGGTKARKRGRKAREEG